MGFHVPSYQAIFASHLFATAMLVSSQHRTVLDKTKNYDQVTRISAYTHGWNFKSCHEVSRKFTKHGIVFSNTVLCEEETNMVDASMMTYKICLI